MADDIEPTAVPTPAEPTGGPGAAVSDPQIDPARYAQLEAYYERTNPVLTEYQEDFNAIVNDEGYRDFQRKSRESYYDMQKRVEAEREAEIPESEKRLLGAIDERLGKFKPVLDDYEQRAQTQAQTVKDETEKFTRDNMEYAQRLVATEGLSNEDVLLLGRVAKAMHDDSVASGAPRRVSIEEAYKRTFGRAEAKATKPVPRSQRAVAGATGVPGAAKPVPSREDLTKPGGVTRHMLGVLNNSRKAG
jgi:hypothetical protein